MKKKEDVLERINENLWELDETLGYMLHAALFSLAGLCGGSLFWLTVVGREYFGVAVLAVASGFGFIGALLFSRNREKRRVQRCGERLK